MGFRGFSVTNHVSIPFQGTITPEQPAFSAIQAPTYGPLIDHGGQDQLGRLPLNGWLFVEKGSGGISRWSQANGDLGSWTDTWPGPGGGTKQGPYYSAQKTYGVLDGERFFSLARTMTRRAGEPNDENAENFNLSKWVGNHDWSNVLVNSPAAIGPIHLPLNLPFSNDAGAGEVGFLVHHGRAIHTDDGAILLLAYGCFKEDATRHNFSWPVEFNMKLWRTIALKSYDQLATLQFAGVVADKYMQARGVGDAPSDPEPALCYAQVQEGFCEPAWCRAKNGDILAVFRTGGRRWSAPDTNQQGTPVYMTRLRLGATEWDVPWQLRTSPSHRCTSSLNPNIVCLGNGALVLQWSQGTGREGNFIAYSNGEYPYVFEGVTHLGDDSNYMGMEKIGYDSVGVVYTPFGLGRRYQRITGIRKIGEANDGAIELFSEPRLVHPGQTAMLQWFNRKIDNLELRGGTFSAGGSLNAAGTAMPSNVGRSTGALAASTTYRLQGIDSDTGAQIKQDFTVRVAA